MYVGRAACDASDYMSVYGGRGYVCFCFDLYVCLIAKYLNKSENLVQYYEIWSNKKKFLSPINSLAVRYGHVITV